MEIEISISSTKKHPSEAREATQGSDSFIEFFVAILNS